MTKPKTLKKNKKSNKFPKKIKKNKMNNNKNYIRKEVRIISNKKINIL